MTRTKATAATLAIIAVFFIAGMILLSWAAKAGPIEEEEWKCVGDCMANGGSYGACIAFCSGGQVAASSSIEEPPSDTCRDCETLAMQYCSSRHSSYRICYNWYMDRYCDDVCNDVPGGGGGGWITSDPSQIKSDLNYTPGEGCGQIATVGYIWRCGFDCQQDKQSCVNHCSTQSSVNGWTASQLVDCENDCDDDYDDCMEDCL